MFCADDTQKSLEYLNLSKAWYERAISNGADCKYMLDKVQYELNSQMNLLPQICNDDVATQELYDVVESDLKKDFDYVWDRLKENAKRLLLEPLNST